MLEDVVDSDDHNHAGKSGSNGGHDETEADTAQGLFVAENA